MLISYITNKISIMQKINRPQYLDYICEDSFEKIIYEACKIEQFEK